MYEKLLFQKGEYKGELYYNQRHTSIEEGKQEGEWREYKWSELVEFQVSGMLSVLEVGQEAGEYEVEWLGGQRLRYSGGGDLYSL